MYFKLHTSLHFSVKRILPIFVWFIVDKSLKLEINKRHVCTFRISCRQVKREPQKFVACALTIQLYLESQL